MLIINLLQITHHFYPEIIHIHSYLHFRIYTENKIHTPVIKNIGNLSIRSHTLSNAHYLFRKKCRNYVEVTFQI